MKYRPHRYPTNYATQIAYGRSRQPAEIYDVARTGAKLKGPRGLRPGDKLRVSVLSNEIEAVVIWTKAPFTGVAFRPEIPDRLVSVICRR